MRQHVSLHDVSLPTDLHGVTSQMTITLSGKAYGNICCSVQKLLSKIENISIYKIILPVYFLNRCETGSLTFME